MEDGGGGPGNRGRAVPAPAAFETIYEGLGGARSEPDGPTTSHPSRSERDHGGRAGGGELCKDLGIKVRQGLSGFVRPFFIKNNEAANGFQSFPMNSNHFLEKL
jgi:hypothetical protein